MADRSTTTSKSNIPSHSPSTTSDIKSPTSRPLYSSKLGDQRVKSSESTASNPTARQPPPQQRAWTSAKNPITGRSQTSQTNFNSQNRPSATNSLREGQRVRITLATGAEYEGTYGPGADSATCRLTQLIQKKLPNSVDLNGARRKEPQAMMSFQRKDITDAIVLPGNPGKPEGKAPNGNRSSFRTDAAISNSRAGGERQLQRWDGGSAGEALEDSLESSTGNRPWNQFEANETLFGLQTDYHEEIYTTTLDRNGPEYRQRRAKADAIARDIERSAPVTAHVAEERVMDYVGGDNRDEEDKYSGVRRQQDFPPLSNRENKYTPPARRAPTGQATVKGAPVDPAIISSQLKGAPSQKQAGLKGDEAKPVVQVTKAYANKPTSENKPLDSKLEAKVDGKSADDKTAESKPEAKLLEVKVTDKNATPARPPPTTSRTSPQTRQGASPAPRNAPNATETVEHDVLNSFKTFATRERQITEKARTTKARQDKEVKLTELKNFANSFKLSTPVPKDLISIIAKDPAKQKEIQEKALLNAEEVAKAKAASEAAVAKEKESVAPKALQAKPVTEQAAASTTAVNAGDPRTTSRPAAPQHTSSSGMQNRHAGGRSSYNNNNQPHYNQYNRNNRPPTHMAPNQPTGNLAQRLRNVEQQKLHHMGQHQPVQDTRLPPTGPSNSTDQSFNRRGQPAYLGPKLNPNSHEFRPNAFAAPFNPTGPSQGSSPRSSVNPVSEAPPPVLPVAGQLIRRKTRAIDIKKCFILSHIETVPLPAGRKWDDNGGLRPSYDTLPTWRQLQEESERPDSTMRLTYNQYFDRLPVSNASIATPNPTHVLPQTAHQYQLPFHLQHGSQNLAPRQSPHMPPMQIHGAQHSAHVPHVPFSAPDDHRMMHSNSAQSFASPRMGQVPMAAYPPTMNAPGQMQYNQQAMQPYMTPGAPPIQYRSFSNNPQYMSQPQHHMGTPMMVQPQYIPPGGMVTAGPQVQLYPAAHPQFIPPGGVPPQQMAASNGYPSPGRPVAPMMVHQGSHQGQQSVYGMSPGMGYQQPAYTPQQAQGKFPTQRPQ